MDAWRMHERDLPVLEHQKSELRHAGEALERQRPGATDDLFKALRYEPGALRAMQELEGPERAAKLLAGSSTRSRYDEIRTFGPSAW